MKLKSTLQIWQNFELMRQKKMQKLQKNILENDLQLVDDFQALEKERANLLQEIKEIYEGMRLSETDARIASYNDGFGKGSMVRDAINDEELSQFVRESYFTTSNLASKAKSSSQEKALFSRKPQLRPHQQLRKLISEDFDSSEELWEVNCELVVYEGFQTIADLGFLISEMK